MVVYYTILLSLILLASVFKKINTKNYLFFIISCLILVLFSGCRYANGDWWNYVQMFKDSINGSTSDYSDRGFVLFLKLIGAVSALPVTMFLFVASTSVVLNFNSIRRYTPYVFLAILLYFVHNFVLKEMIQIRVGLASALCLYSIRYLVDNKYLMTILFWLIALSIHFSAIIFGIAILLKKIELTKTTLLIMVLISLFIGVFFPLGGFIKEQMGISDKLDEYIAYGDGGYAASMGVWTNPNTLKTLFFFFFLYIQHDSLCGCNKYFRTLFLSYSIGLCWLICFNDFAIIGARMSNLMLSVEPILLTLPLLNLSKYSSFVYKSLLIVLSVVIFQNNISPDKITPYKFYFDYL